MNKVTTSVEQYIADLPDERREAFTTLFSVIRNNIDPKFAEGVSYGMPGWNVPKTAYPHGYHVDSTLPVPFLSVANQKNYIALYHMGIYADEDLLQWFTREYATTGNKLDMGKSCIRFKDTSKIPYDLIGRLVARMSLDDYMALYLKTIAEKKSL